MFLPLLAPLAAYAPPQPYRRMAGTYFHSATTAHVSGLFPCGATWQTCLDPYFSVLVKMKLMTTPTLSGSRMTLLGIMCFGFSPRCAILIATVNSAMSLINSARSRRFPLTIGNTLTFRPVFRTQRRNRLIGSDPCL